MREATLARPRLQVWRKPLSNTLVVNTSVAWVAVDKLVNVGVVARNYKGEIIDRISMKMFCSSLFATEALAIKLALKLATKFPSLSRV